MLQAVRPTKLLSYLEPVLLLFRSLDSTGMIYPVESNFFFLAAMMGLDVVFAILDS
jgi:hypothetical protein